MHPLRTPRTFGWGGALVALPLVMAGYAWVATCDRLYLRTADHPFLQPWNILEGRSQSPYQYRVLASVLYLFVKRTFAVDAATADHVALVVSMVLCLFATGLLFYRSSRSLAMTSLAQLALLGCFTFGIVTKVRQEFLEVALVSANLLTLLEVRPRVRMYRVLMLISALGALNRETFACAIIATSTHVLWQRRGAAAPAPLLSDLGALGLLAATFALMILGTRVYFGISSYAVPFWMLEHSAKVLQRLDGPGHLLNMGAGMLAAFLSTVVAGNRNYLAFIVGYSVPLVLMTSVAANLTEHRIFYPMMALMVASMTRFAQQGCQRGADEALS